MASEDTPAAEAVSFACAMASIILSPDSINLSLFNSHFEERAFKIVLKPGRPKGQKKIRKFTRMCAITVVRLDSKFNLKVLYFLIWAFCLPGEKTLFLHQYQQLTKLRSEAIAQSELIMKKYCLLNFYIFCSWINKYC